MSNVVDWDISADAENIRPGSIELQRTIHQSWFQKIKERPREGWLKAKPLWRIRTIEKLEVRLGRPLFGEVLEIGAGTALCSTFAAQRAEVTRVTASDYDEFCVNDMMPLVFEKFGAPTEKIRRALGSYNKLPEQGFYDFIIAVGALHHAEDLEVAFRENLDALKPGGVMLVSDVCESDRIGNRELTDRYEALDPDGEARYGRPVKIKENGDHWYRLHEWLTASRNAGFEVLPYLFDKVRGEPADDSIFAEPKLWRGHQIRVFQPYFSDRGLCDSLVLILQKPDENGETPLIPADLACEDAPPASQPATGSEAPVPAPQAEREREEVLQLKERLQAANDKISRLRERATELKQRLAKREEKLASKQEKAKESADDRG